MKIKISFEFSGLGARQAAAMLTAAIRKLFGSWVAITTHEKNKSWTVSIAVHEEITLEEWEEILQ